MLSRYRAAYHFTDFMHTARLICQVVTSSLALNGVSKGVLCLGKRVRACSGIERTSSPNQVAGAGHEGMGYAIYDLRPGNQIENSKPCSSDREGEAPICASSSHHNEQGRCSLPRHSDRGHHGAGRHHAKGKTKFNRKDGEAGYADSKAGRGNSLRTAPIGTHSTLMA